MKTLCLAFFLILTACSTVAQHQDECESKYPKFQDMTICLKQKVKADPMYELSDEKVYAQRYLLEADKLSNMVRKKQISETDARIKLSDLYIRLKSIVDNNERAEAAEWQNLQLINKLNQPKTTHCYGGYGGYGSVSCTTY